MPPTQPPPHLKRRYYVQNWRADVVAMAKSDGTPLEYVFYSAYGEATVHPIADVDMDGDVDSYDAAAWDNGENLGLAYNYVPANVDLNWDGTEDAADDALFDESYAANVGLSGKGRMSSVGVGNRKGYAGYEHDESITMYHVRHRVYRPDLGRWMTRDPLGYVDGMSLYEYVAGMAVAGRDHTGFSLDLQSVGTVTICPPGYELSPDGTQCVKSLPTDGNPQMPAQPPGPPGFPPFSSDCVLHAFMHPFPNGTGCNSYPPGYTYSGADAQCFCNCAGNSAWAQHVRSCLQCRYKYGEGPHEAHFKCYASATWLTGVTAVPVGRLTKCYHDCGGTMSAVFFVLQILGQWRPYISVGSINAKGESCVRQLRTQS
jgi:RHS repeat-associated protein